MATTCCCCVAAAAAAVVAVAAVLLAAVLFSCVFMCAFMLHPRANRLPHLVHSWGFWPVGRKKRELIIIGLSFLVKSAESGGN